jgi:tetratricopeptide (TPR) repeat protein
MFCGNCLQNPFKIATSWSFLFFSSPSIIVYYHTTLVPFSSSSLTTNKSVDEREIHLSPERLYCAPLYQMALLIDTAFVKALLASDDISAIKKGLSALTTKEMLEEYSEAMIEDKQKWLQLQVMLHSRVLKVQEAKGAKPSDISKTYRRVADVWNRMGESDKAVGQLQKSLAVEPDNLQSLQLLSSTHVNLAEYGKAIDVQKKLMEVMSSQKVSDADSLLAKAQLATIYDAKGEFQTAITLLKECESICTKETYLAEIYSRLGLILEKIGMYKEAIDNLTKARDIFKRTKGKDHKKTQEVAYLLEMAQSTEMTTSPY